MWLSTKFCWWTFLSSLIQKEEKNFYLFWCSFTCKSTDYIQCTVSLSTYLFCMWLSTNFHWWAFLSSSIQKEEKNFYLFWCSFTWKSTDYIQCTVSLSTYLFCMWLSIKFCWWTFVSSSIQKEENNFYLFRCWFPCKSTDYVQSLNIFILHMTFNKLSLMNICIFINSKRRK